MDKVPVPDLCKELGLQPTVPYRWQKEFFENGAAAFPATERLRRQAEEKQKRIEFLEKKMQAKDEVLAELMAEHIALKNGIYDVEPRTLENTTPTTFRMWCDRFLKPAGLGDVRA